MSRFVVGLTGGVGAREAVAMGSEGLEEVVAAYGVRYFKLKVGGDDAADLDRLEGIASILDREHNNRIEQAYRPDDFPWIEPSIKQPVPQDSIAHDHRLLPGENTALEECDAETWLGSTGARKVDVLSEQVLAQRDGWAMVLLHAELVDPE